MLELEQREEVGKGGLCVRASEPRFRRESGPGLIPRGQVSAQGREAGAFKGRMAERDRALDGLGLDEEDTEEEGDMAVLKRVWRNEKCAPVLLQYEEVRAIIPPSPLPPSPPSLGSADQSQICCPAQNPGNRRVNVGGACSADRT